MVDTNNEDAQRNARRRGIYALAAFLTMGLLLEGAIGFRLPFLMDADHVGTRTLLRLAHAHGALLAVVRIATVHGSALPDPFIDAGMILVPLGFLLGAVGARGHDPSPAVALVPVGAVFLLGGLLRTARQM